MMTAKRLLEALLFPLTNSAVLLALLTFVGLAYLASIAGVLGIWLAIVIVPAVLRYQMVLLEACARGQQPEPPGVEYFSWTDNLWTLFPVVIVVVFGLLARALYDDVGATGVIAVLLFAAATYPAMLGVLAITHSPIQALNPVAITRFIGHSLPLYLIGPAYLLLIAVLIPQVATLNPLLAAIVEMFFVFSFHAVVGATIQPAGIVDDVDIPEPLAPDEATVAESIKVHRAATLAHAYHFISRGSRDNGFDHIEADIQNDPEPARAWLWYFEQMQAWDEPQHALFFAQRVIRDMLQHGETVPALKLLLRCHMQNEQFRPFRDDIPQLLAAAEANHNHELTAVLKAM